MKDPYKVLNVSRNATDEEIRTAYRELAKKYHPDNYVNNPLADLAVERMKEINEAYDTIMKERANGSGSRPRYENPYGSYSGVREESNGGAFYVRVRQVLRAGNLMEAERLLNTVPGNERDAEWNFLMGSVLHTKGWINDARIYYEQACTMDPSNPEYAAAYNYINSYRQAQQQHYSQPYRNGQAYNTGGMSTCDCCSNLICADCCCEMMGGDLISCC